jgi:DNA-binding response OmpR family regulator
MPHRILIAEDNQALAQVLRINLQQAGFEVIVAGDGQSAWDECERLTFDMVITDHQMPLMTGVELCRRLLARADAVEPPIILLTANAFGVEVQTAAIDLPQVAIISKPFSPSLLVTTVKKMLRERLAT